MSTDHDWSRWGRQDPYFAVVTDPQFRLARLTPSAKQAFFADGRRHVDYVLHGCRQLAGASFKPARVLDFGCGVGRVLLPFARLAEAVVGVDVAPAMLEQARANADEQGLRNVALALSDDALSRVDGRFDLVHSSITLQHIAPARGRALFARLVERVADGGIGAIHLTYAKVAHPRSFGRQPAWAARPRLRFWRCAAGREPDDPGMRMHSHDLNEIMFILQSAGVERLHLDFTNHGGELGTFLFFAAPDALGGDRP